MPHEECEHEHHHEHEHKSAQGHRSKLHMKKPLKLVFSVVGAAIGLVFTGLSLFAITIVAGPASEITQSIAGLWQGVLNTLQPLADLYNQTIDLISGISGAE